MDNRRQEILLSQGLDCSPSPTASFSRALNKSTTIDKSHLCNKSQTPSSHQSFIPKRQKLCESPSEKELSAQQKTLEFVQLSRDSIERYHSFYGSTESKPAASVHLRSSHPLTNTTRDSKKVEALSKNRFSLDRSRLSLPAFSTADRSNVMTTGQLNSRFSDYCKTTREVKSGVATAENTCQHIGELSVGLVPEARSSAVHDFSSLNSTNGTNPSINTVFGRQRHSVPSISEPATPLLDTKSRSKSIGSRFMVGSRGRDQSARQGGSSFSLPLPHGAGSVHSTLPAAVSEVNATHQAAEMEGDSEICKTIVSVIWHKGLLGACLYSTDTMRLQLLQDIPEDVNFLSTTQLFMQTQPDVIITGARQDSRFLETLKDLVSSDEEGRQQRIHLLSNEELGYELCKKRLVMTCENTLARGKADMEAFIKSTVNLNFVNMVRASGGLLRHLETNAVNLAVSFDRDMAVLAVELYMTSSQVWMDASTFSGLRILHLADHPSTSLGNRYTREGFSLFGLMDRCKTSAGKLKLKELFLKPSRDMQLLNDRLDCLEYLNPSKMSEVTQLVKSHLGRLRNMSRIVCKMRNAELKGTDWLTMHRVLQSLIVITDVCTEHRQDLPILSKTCHLCWNIVCVLRERELSAMKEDNSHIDAHNYNFSEYRESIHSAGQILFDILDVEQTKLCKSFSVKPNYDDEMDTLTQRQRDLPELLAERLTTHVKEVKQLVRSAVHIHYSSQLGCLLMIDITPRMERTGDYSVSGLKLEFLTESNAYYSSEFTREISELHGDVNTDITDRSLALMYQLQNTLLPDMDNMLKVLDLCAQLDCFIGLSSYCYDHNYVRPELNNQDLLRIKGGRHALLDAQVDHFISNDTVSGPGEDNPRVMIMTGPNACGKSIYLKQTFLIVYLAHIGCLVPAESANIFLADALLAHFPTSDSINSEVSTFTAALSRMATIVNNATDKTLVALDEFGKGTCPVDGASLLLAFLHQWLKSGAKHCPHVLATSHFHVICKSSWIKDSPLASLKTLETHVENGKLVYLYELADGATESSHAAAIAQLLEIPIDYLTQGAQANDQFALVRHVTKADRNSEHNRWKRNVVEKMLQLDLDDEENALRFLNSVIAEQ